MIGSHCFVHLTLFPFLLELQYHDCSTFGFVLCVLGALSGFSLFVFNMIFSVFQIG